MNDELSYQEIKEIVREISEEEIKKYNLDVKMNFFTVLEYYNSDFFKKRFKLSKKKLSELTIPLYAAGFFDPKTNEIVLFSSELNVIRKIERKVFRLAEICYHELRHQEQMQFDRFSYNGFFRSTDYFCRCFVPGDYLSEHSKYSFEIGAHLYSIANAKKYMQRKYPDLYEKEKEYIEKYEQKHMFYYKTYDAAETIDRFILILKKNKKNIENNNNPDRAKLYDEIYPILTIFLDADYNPKKIRDIINNPRFNKLDERIVCAFLSSKTFLENINFEELNKEELLLLDKSLEYTNGIYKKQLELLEKQKDIELVEFLKIEKNIIKKLGYRYGYFVSKTKHKLNSRRNDSEKIEHMKSIPEYIDKTNEMLKRRINKGYITIDIFYILGFILSILTIIYLFIK